MSKLIIQDIKRNLKSLYPSYAFEVKCTADDYTYIISVYKDRKNLSTYSAKADTPSNVFWDSVKDWMRTVINR